jgi:hypothetical protein
MMDANSRFLEKNMMFKFMFSLEFKGDSRLKKNFTSALNPWCSRQALGRAKNERASMM